MYYIVDDVFYKNFQIKNPIFLILNLIILLGSVYLLYHFRSDQIYNLVYLTIAIIIIRYVLNIITTYKNIQNLEDEKNKQKTYFQIGLQLSIFVFVVFLYLQKNEEFLDLGSEQFRFILTKKHIIGYLLILIYGLYNVSLGLQKTSDMIYTILVNITLFWILNNFHNIRYG